MSYLYRYETKGIQSWILSSNKLRDLAGGSALVEGLTAAAREGALEHEARVIQATSGAMTALFPSLEKLEAFASEWPMQVAYRAPGLQLVQAWVPEKEGQDALFEALSRKRNEIELTQLDLNPWVLRAGRSGLPAVRIPEGLRSNARQTAVDQIAVAKERARADARRDQAAEVLGGCFWEDFEESLEAWPEGPVAVIHADGSGVGQRLQSIGKEGNLDKFESFSAQLKAASAAATRAAVGTLRPGKEGGKLFARPVVSAGDDLTFILRASEARRFCEAWLRAFEAETEKHKDALKGKLYAGAGIVMLNRGYPFAAAYEMAEALCKAAKDAAKKDDPNRSVLAFRRITNSLVDDVASGTAAWIVDGDATADAPLERLVNTVRDLPRGTLRTWLDHYQRPDGETRAGQLWARAEEVAKEREWKDFRDALSAVGANPDTGGFEQAGQVALPLGNEKRPTPVYDALTLRFVERNGEEH